MVFSVSVLPTLDFFTAREDSVKQVRRSLGVPTYTRPVFQHSAFDIQHSLRDRPLHPCRGSALSAIGNWKLAIGNKAMPQRGTKHDSEHKKVAQTNPFDARSEQNKAGVLRNPTG
jgi:hypothetical protein